jgi:hypothetical protein
MATGTSTGLQPNIARLLCYELGDRLSFHTKALITSKGGS